MHEHARYIINIEITKIINIQLTDESTVLQLIQLEGKDGLHRSPKYTH